MEWLDEALCRDKHIDLWFPPTELPSAEQQLYNDVAKLVCDACPIRVNCEQLGELEEWGTWGGVTRGERRRGTPFTAPRRRLNMGTIMTVVPRHIPDAPISDIRALRARIMGEATRKKAGEK